MDKDGNDEGADVSATAGGTGWEDGISGVAARETRRSGDVKTAAAVMAAA